MVKCWVTVLAEQSSVILSVRWELSFESGSLLMRLVGVTVFFQPRQFLESANHQDGMFSYLEVGLLLYSAHVALFLEIIVLSLPLLSRSPCKTKVMVPP